MRRSSAKMLKKLRTPAAFVPMARRIPEQVSCLVTKPTSDKIVMSHSLIGCHIHLGGTKGFFDQHATERDLVSEILKSRKVKGRSVWLEAETAVKGGQMGITMADSDGGVVVSEFGEARFHQCLRNGSAAISFLDTKARAVTKRFRKSSDLKRDFQAGWSLAGVEPNNAGYGAMQSSVDM